MKTQKLEKVRLKEHQTSSSSPLVPRKALADMKQHSWQQMQQWPHRELAFASIQFVSDHFSLDMTDKDIYRTALGLMTNGYEAPMIRRARKRLLIDIDFAQRRHCGERVLLEAADFETALQNDPVDDPSRSSSRMSSVPSC